MSCAVSIQSPWVRSGPELSSNYIIGCHPSFLRTAPLRTNDQWVELQLLVKLANRTHVVSFHVVVQPSLVARVAYSNASSSDSCNLLASMLLNTLPTEWEVACALSNKTGIPAAFLIVHNLPLSEMCLSLKETIVTSSANFVNESRNTCLNFFVNAALKSFIRGGKGGFGSLLKGQSKKAAAKTTLDFGACRDLTGRRLRHINDEIKLRKWHQALALKNQGVPINEDEHYQTKSGIENWFLDIPNWALDAYSDKSRRMNERRIQRSIQRQQWDQQQIQQREREKQEARERKILEYANVALEVVDDNRMSDAIAQGMKRRQQKVQSKQEQEQLISNPEPLAMHEQTAHQGKHGDQNKQVEEDCVAKRRKIENSELQPSECDIVENGWFCSLSGDIVTDNTALVSDNKQHLPMEILIQATSDFSTGCVLLPDSCEDSILNGGLIKGKWYYEIILQTAQVAQIGWASNDFTADSISGNGVGDDCYSYGYDGSRGLKFHGEQLKEESSVNEEETGLQYGSNNRWGTGDVIGCLLDVDDGIISFSINGENIGPAFTISKENFDGLFPAVSLNCGEVLRVRLSNFTSLPKVRFP